MDAFIPWVTPAVVLAVFAWLRADIRNIESRIDKRFDGVDKRFDGVNARIDGLNASVNARIDNAVRELRSDIAGVNARIDAVLLADRDRGKQDRGAA